MMLPEMLRAYVVEALRTRMQMHPYDGGGNWYIDQFTIDCDAEAFWPLAAQVAVDAVLASLKNYDIDVVEIAESQAEEMAEGVARAWYGGDPE